MSIKKNDVLKKVLQKAELDRPPLNFTALVMKEVEAEAQHEVVLNPALGSLLKRHSIEKPSFDFTNRVMKQVEVFDVKSTYKPIISERVWYIISTVAVFFFVYLGFSGQTTTSPKGLTPYFINMGNTLNTIFAKVSTVPSLYLITFISMSILLLMDYFFKVRGDQHGKKSETQGRLLKY